MFCECYALHEQSGLTLDFTIDQQSLYSGITSSLCPIGGIMGQDKLNAAKHINVETRTLTELLDKCSAPQKIQYLSLDVEGAELLALNGIDWDKYQFGVINIEHNFSVDRSTIRSFIEQKGYKYHSNDRWDDWYIWGTGLDEYK
jgi:FkbM family methyltransferase